MKTGTLFSSLLLLVPFAAHSMESEGKPTEYEVPSLKKLCLRKIIDEEKLITSSFQPQKLPENLKEDLFPYYIGSEIIDYIIEHAIQLQNTQENNKQKCCLCNNIECELVALTDEHDPLCGACIQKELIWFAEVKNYIMHTTNPNISGAIIYSRLSQLPCSTPKDLETLSEKIKTKILAILQTYTIEKIDLFKYIYNTVKNRKSVHLQEQQKALLSNDATLQKILNPLINKSSFETFTANSQCVIV